MAQDSNTGLNHKLEALDEEFKGYLAQLKFNNHFEGADRLGTFSPIDVVQGFEHDGLRSIRETGRKDMINDDEGMRKLLANMLALCQPGSLSDDDLEQLTGINGREVNLEA